MEGRYLGSSEVSPELGDNTTQSNDLLKPRDEGEGVVIFCTVPRESVSMSRSMPGEALSVVKQLPDEKKSDIVDAEAAELEHKKIPKILMN